jgi:hypothetical protein
MNDLEKVLLAKELNALEENIKMDLILVRRR